MEIIDPNFIVFVPKFFATKPLLNINNNFIEGEFLSSAKEEGISMGYQVIWLGGFDPYEIDTNLQTIDRVNWIWPKLTIDHFEILLGLKVLRNIKKQMPFSFSIDELYGILQNKNQSLKPNSTTRSKIKLLISELSRIWMKVRNNALNIQNTFPIFTLGIEKKGLKFQSLDCINSYSYTSFSFFDQYIDWIVQKDNSVAFNASALFSMRSNTAKLLYTYLPSRAVYNFSPEKSFKIKLGTLVNSLSPDCSFSKYSSKRLNWANRFIGDLDKAPLVNGLLRAQISPCIGNKDYNLIVWVENKKIERRKTNESNTILYKDWVSSGKTAEKYFKKVKKSKYLELDGYEKNIFDTHFSKSEFESIYVFLRKSKSLLGEENFKAVLCQFKEYCLNSSAWKIKSKKALLISLLRKPTPYI